MRVLPPIRRGAHRLGKPDRCHRHQRNRGIRHCRGDFHCPGEHRRYFQAVVRDLHLRRVIILTWFVPPNGVPIMIAAHSSHYQSAHDTFRTLHSECGRVHAVGKEHTRSTAPCNAFKHVRMLERIGSSGASCRRGRATGYRHLVSRRRHGRCRLMQRAESFSPPLVR